MTTFPPKAFCRIPCFGVITPRDMFGAKYRGTRSWILRQTDALVPDRGRLGMSLFSNYCCPGKKNVIFRIA